MVVLIDQDGPLANWEYEFLRRWRYLYPQLPFVDLDRRRNFHAVNDYEDLAETPVERRAMRLRVEGIYCAAGFYENLPVVEGAVEAVMEMLEHGYDIRICTSPMKNYRNCVLEKYEWIDRHFGPDLTRRTILTRDKAIIHGDVLIDDSPAPSQIGNRTPAWEHVVYDAPYNRQVDGRRRIKNWRDWQPILDRHSA